MKLVWHIVKKDAWQQRFLIAGVVVAAGVLTFLLMRFFSVASEIGSPIRQIGAVSGIASLALVVLAWLLVASLVHAEGLAGTHDHWLSRPIRVGELLAAKVIGAFLFVVVPAVLLQVAVLSAGGFALRDYWLGLICRTGVMTATWLLPVFGLATITRNWLQLGAGLVGMLILAAGSLAFAAGYFFEPPEQFGEVVQNGMAAAVAVLAVAISSWQYRCRRVGVARVAAVFGLCTAIIVPTRFSPALYSAARRMAPSAGNLRQEIRVIPDPARSASSFSNQSLPGMYVVTIPLHVEGLANGLSASISIPRESKIVMDGNESHEHLQLSENLNLVFNFNGFRLRRAKTMQIRAHAYVTVRAAVRRFAMPTLNGSLRTPELGHCRSWVRDRLHILCLRPYEFSSTIRGFLTRDGPTPLNLQVFSEYPAPWPLAFESHPIPLAQGWGGFGERNLDQGEQYRDTSIVFEVSDVLSRFEQDIVIDVPASARR